MITKKQWNSIMFRQNSGKLQISNVLQAKHVLQEVDSQGRVALLIKKLEVESKVPNKNKKESSSVQDFSL